MLSPLSRFSNVTKAPVRQGRTTKGTIKTMMRGQSSGLIRTTGRDVFFHKSDVQTNYSRLNAGDGVVFELMDDPISGPRAQNVRATKPEPSR
jgi:cold shock CspA family protein